MNDAALLAQTSPAGLAYITTQGAWIPYKHLVLLNEHLLALTARETDRLLVTLPPRHGKSVLVSQYLPAWYLGRYPDKQVLLASYEHTFARSWGRKARNVLEEHGPPIFGVHVADEPRAADWWQTTKGGVMITAGVGGALTGKGADLLLIDDPVKNAEEAASETIREKAWDWWQSTASTRLQPGGVVALILTRWNEDDLAGRILDHEGDQWTILNLPAIAEHDDPLDRGFGEALCPELYDHEALARIREQVGSYFWEALYQQRPAPPEGFLFKRQDFRYWRLETGMVGAIQQRLYTLEDTDNRRVFDAAMTPRFQTVDAAISEKETADYTVIATWAATPHGDLILLDLERQHFENQQVAMFLASASDKHGRPPMWVERFGAGRNPLATLGRMGYPVREIPPEAGTQTDKITRAFGAVALLERHRLFIPHAAPWLDAYLSELASFPHARHDDMADVTAYAARLLPQMLQPVIRKRDPFRQLPKPISAGVLAERY